MMVGEIVLGILVGFINVGVEQATGQTIITFADDSHAYFLSEIGLIFLLFLAGMEIDFNMIGERGPKPLFAGVIAFMATFAIALGITTAIGLEAPLFLALVISTTSLGVVIPVVRELGISRSEYGQDLILGAIIADFATMLMIPLVVAVQNGEPVLLPAIILPLVALFFFSIYFFGGWLLWRYPQVMAKFFEREDPNETGVRASFLLIMIFVVLSSLLETELILGAFLAGAAIAFLFRESGNLESKLFGFGYGFLIPLFFIRTGVEFTDMVEPGGLLIVPALVGAAFVVKLAPSMLFVRTHGVRNSLSIGILISARLSLLIAAVNIGLRAGIDDVVRYAPSLIILALVMCVAAPIGFKLLYRPRGEDEAADEVEPIYEIMYPEER